MSVKTTTAIRLWWGWQYAVHCRQSSGVDVEHLGTR